MKIRKSELIDLLKDNTFNTIGCTEVISIILATSAAYHAIGGRIEQIDLTLDKNLFKNAFSVIIPGTSEWGLKFAVALGLTLNNWNMGLLISDEIDQEKVEVAQKLALNKKINIDLHYETDSIYVKAVVKTDSGKGLCLIENKHDNITLLKNDRTILIDRTGQKGEAISLDLLGDDLNIKALIDLIDSLCVEDLEFLEEGIVKNLEAAQAGIAKKTGLGLGFQLACLIEAGRLENNVINRAKMLVAGAADARMGGLKTSIVGCFGSGNHGITIFIPLKVMADDLGSSRGKLYKSIALAEILTAYIKSVTGIVTSHCGDIIATGVGIAGGASYMQGKSALIIEKSLQILIANLYGVVCDGAKPTCALKITTAVQAGLESSIIAEEINDFELQGVVGETFSQTLKNLDFLIKKDGGAMDYHIIELLKSRN